MIRTYRHQIIVNNKPVGKPYTKLAYALEKRDELRAQGKYAMVSTYIIAE